MATGGVRHALAALALLATAAGPAAALDLAGALREAATANPTLASRREAAEAARHRVAPAGAWSAPMLELGALDVPASGGFARDPMTMKMVGIEQSVPLFGGNRLSRGAARAAADAEGAGLANARYETLAETWEAYADTWFADQLSRSAVDHQSEMDRLVRSARARYESGGGRLDDVLSTEAERARTLADLAAYGAEARAARARLAATLGRDGAVLADTLAPPPEPAALPADPAALLAALDDAHPRLRELTLESERYRLAARAARRMAWPDVRLGFNYGVREPIAGIRQDDLWSATVGLALPVFAGSREADQGAELDAMARAAQADRRAAALELARQLRALHATALADQRTVGLLADTVVVTQQRALAAAWSAYGAGTADLSRVFEADHMLYAEEIALVRARQDRARTMARLLALTARGDLLGITLPEAPRTAP